MSEPGAAETGAKEEANRESLFKNLLNRRVPQIIGLYIAASWGIVQFVDWLVNRYLLSPNLVDLALVILLSLIPSSIIVAYYHGRPGRDRWDKPEKIGIPLNVVISFFLVFFLFHEKDLSKVSQTVTLEDESGKKIERTIPKNQFRKKVVLFYFKNETGDKSLDWLQMGVPSMLKIDLEQDIFIETLSPNSLGGGELDFPIYRKIEKAGYKGGVGLPFSLAREIAKDFQMEYFLLGKINKEGEEFVLKRSLFLTKNSKLTSEGTVRGANIFSLIDQLSVKLKHDLGIPKGHIEDVNDMPITEIFTNSLPAARLYFLGQESLVFENDWKKAQQYFEESVRLDSTFANAYSYLSIVYLTTGQSQKWIDVYKPLMQNIYKLPERTQFYVKVGYYQTKGDADKQVAVLKMITKLFPEDIDAYGTLALLYASRNNLDDTLAMYQRILEIDPQRYKMFHDIGNIYKRKGEFAAALDYYTKYAEHFPDDPESFKSLGGLNAKLGDYKRAKENYEKALLLKADDIGVLTALAEIEVNLGNVDEAYEQFLEALKLSTTAKEKKRAYDALASFCRKTGRLKKALEYGQLSCKAFAEYAAPIMVANQRLVFVEDYINAGEKKEAFKELEDLKTAFPPPYDRFVALGYVIVYLALEEPDEIEKLLPELEEAIAVSKQEGVWGLIHHARGRIHEMRKEYAEALESYQLQLKVFPSDTEIMLQMGRCYRLLKDNQKAEDYLGKMLKIHPFSPEANYEMALLYLEMGSKEKAIEHLKKAEDVWKGADPDYKPAFLVREKLAELE